MPLTAGKLRLDLKCGSGYIAQSKKCHKESSPRSSMLQQQYGVPPKTE